MRLSPVGILTIGLVLVVACGTCSDPQDSSISGIPSGGSVAGQTGGGTGGSDCKSDADCPSGNTVCRYARCLSDGSCGFIPAPYRSACAEGEGLYCDGYGNCVRCTRSSDCPSGACQAGQCVPASCTDGALNQGETNVDCGGPCPGCVIGAPCYVPDDCLSWYCDLGVGGAGGAGGNNASGICSLCQSNDDCAPVLGAQCVWGICTTLDVGSGGSTAQGGQGGQGGQSAQGGQGGQSAQGGQGGQGAALSWCVGSAGAGGSGGMVPHTSGLSALFDGTNEYVEFGDVHGFSQTSPFSAFLWVKTSFSGNQALIGKRLHTASKNGWQLAINAPPELLALDLWQSSSSRIELDAATSGLLNGQWHHVGFTYDGSSDVTGCVLYLDSVALTPTNQSSTLNGPIATTAKFTLGARNGQSAFLNGLMDEATLYDAALSNVQVVELYNAGVPPDPSALSSSSHLIGWWTMGDGDQWPYLCDRSGSGTHGTMTNMESTDFIGDVPP